MVKQFLTYQEFLNESKKRKKKKNLTALNRVVDIQDPDTGYEMVKKAHNKGRIMMTVNGHLITDIPEDEQPNVD